MSYYNIVDMDKLLGHNIVDVQGLEKYSDTVTLITDKGDRFWFDHMQDCCESVSLEDFVLTGDLKGTVMRAYESSEEASGPNVYDSGTWTFYRIETPQGSLFMRWLGTSNGYYSEGVDLHYEEA